MDKVEKTRFNSYKKKMKKLSPIKTYISLDAFFLFKPPSWADSQQWIILCFVFSIQEYMLHDYKDQMVELQTSYVQYYDIHHRHQLLKIKLRPFNHIFFTLSSCHFSQINFSAALSSNLSMKQPTGIFVWLNVLPPGLGNVCISCCQILPASQLVQGHSLLQGREDVPQNPQNWTWGKL